MEVKCEDCRFYDKFYDIVDGYCFHRRNLRKFFSGWDDPKRYVKKPNERNRDRNCSLFQDREQFFAELLRTGNAQNIHS